MSISRVQGQATASSGTVTSQAGTVASGVTSGNLLVASVTTGAIGNTVTPPTGWTQGAFNNPNSPANCETGLWWGIVGSGGLSAGGTSWTFSFGSAHNVYIIIEEWNSTSGWNASPIDQTAVGNTAGTATTSTTPLTGTTSTTTQATELWVASLTYDGAPQTESSITSGWTKDLETHDTSNNHTATMLYQVVSSTGAVSCQYTIGTAQHWAGAVATFKASPTTNSRAVPATAALQGTFSRTIPSTAALQATLTRTVPATTALKGTFTRTIPATAALSGNARIIPATAALQSTLTRTVPTSAAMTVTSSRTVPASASLAASAIFYASNVAQTAGGLTQSDQMSQVSGGTETSFSVTMPSSGTNSYVELLAQGGTASGTAALPAPTGKGWSISLAGNTILAGSWSFAFTLAKSGSNITGASLICRAFRRTMDGTYYPIAISILNQTLATVKTTYTTPSVTASWPWQFINGDTLYLDAFVFNAGTAWSSDVFTVYVSNSATQGVSNDGTIIAPQMETTPSGLNCLIGSPAFQTANAGLPVLRESFTLADAIDQRSILTLTGEDVNGTLSYQRGQPVQFSDHDQGVLYTGAVNSDKVSKPAAGGAAQLEHALTFMDPHYLVDKRANVTNYLNWAAGDMVADFIQSTLSQENITGAFALEADYTPTTFGQGTLSGTVATSTTSPFTYAPNTASPPITSNTGDLELTRAGTQFALTESVTSDFSSGTLTNMTAASNSLSPNTVSALKFTVDLPIAGAGNTIGTPSSLGPTGTGGSTELATDSIYAQIWSGSVNVGTNDTFNYDIWISSTSPAYMAGVDLLFSDGTYLSSYNGTKGANHAVWDQNGLTPDVLTDLTGYAQNTWCTRNISLNTLLNGAGGLTAGVNLAGKTITSVYLFVAGGTAGQYTIYVKNCYLGSASGSPFFSTSATSTNVNPPVLTTNGGYPVATSAVSVVHAWIPTASSRVSPAHSISGVGLVQSSNITWTASLPTSGAATTPYPPGFSSTGTSSNAVSPASLIFVSYDGNTWLACTNSAPLPGLPAGANVAGLSMYLLEQFSAGNDPTAVPSLLQVNVTINSAASQTTSDITAAYGTTSAWNTGTESGTAPNSNGDLALPSSYTWSSSTGVTSYSQHATVTVSSGTVTVNSTSGFGAGAVRFDFAGFLRDFTANFTMKLSSGSSSNPECFFYYRASNISNAGISGTYIPPNGYALRLYINDGGSSNAQLVVYANGTQIQTLTLTLSLGTTYTFKVAVSGNVHAIYLNGTLEFVFYDSTVTSAGNLGFSLFGSGTTNDTAVFGSFNFTTPVLTEGTWTSPSINLNSLGTCGYTQVAWSEINAAGAAQSTAIVLASTNGGTSWSPCSNGAEVPGLTPGTSVSGISLQLQMVLFATSAITTPIIPGLYVRVCGNYGTVTGTRISPALSLSPVGYVASSNVMWNANIPTNTTLTVATSQDASTWTNVGNNGAGASLGYWTNQPSATQDLFNTNTSANYTSTHKAGGSNTNATWTYDTPNSRITATSGVGALYLYTSGGTMTDMDMLCDMDESDTGGLCWRVVDTSNYYELVVYDASSSGGFTNILQLNKVAGGTRTLLGSAPSITFTRTTFHRVRVTMQGGLINVYFDGQCVQSYLDTSPLGAGQCGLRHNGGVSRYYQLWIQALGTNLSGQTLYTKVTMTTSDPSVMPQLFTLVACVRGPSIATGATISQLHPVTTPFASYYSNEMDSLVQASGDFYWYVDKWRVLHFGPRLARPGAFPIQSIADPANVNATNTYYSGSLLYQPQVTVLSSADLFRSEQIVTNVTGLVNPPTEVKVADGSTTSWTLGYPVYSAPTITVNGQSTTVGVQGIDNNRQFYWQPGSASISYDSSLPKLPSGAILNITYVGQSTVNVVLNNGTTQAAQAAAELNSGIVAEIESAMRTGTNGMTTSQATTFGNGLLSRYGNNGTIEMIGTTRYPGLAPGTTTALFLPEMMATWDAQIPIVKVTTTGYQSVNGMAYFYSIDATTGPSLSNWTRVFFT